MAIPGDIVRTPDGDRIAVDVVHDEDATYIVHRSATDLDGEHLEAHTDADVEVIGHVAHVPGWVEDAPGQWRQA